MPKFSIIVPIYNVGDYLDDCLTSIIKQSFDDFECLLINDGSTDNSPDIAKDYSVRDDRFKFYNKSNGGLSDARNYGLERAVGDYIVFIDSDDIIHLRLLEYVNKAIIENQCDLVYFEYKKFFTHNDDYNSLFMSDDEHYSFKAITNAQLAQMPNFAWARIANRKLYSEIRFPKGYIYEDVLTSPLLSSKAQTIGYLSNKLYGYRKRENSITTQSAEKQFRLFETVHLLNDFVDNSKVQYIFYSTALVNLIQSCLVSLVRIEKYSTRKEFINLIVEEYNSLNYKNVLGCYSFNKFKILTLLAKNKITLTLLSMMLRPVVLVSDKKGK